MFYCRHLILALAFLLGGCVANDNVIEILEEEKPTSRSFDRTSTRTFGTRISLLDDLFSLPSFTFRGLDESVVFTKIKSVTQRRNNGSEQLIWTGAIEGRVGFATIMRFVDGDWAASFTTETTTYTLTTLPDKRFVVTATAWADLPDEAPEEERQQQQQQQKQVAPNPMLRSKTVAQDEVQDVDLSSSVSVSLDYSSGERTESVGDSTVFSPTNERRQLQDSSREEKELEDTITTTIDVLVVVTNRAMCESAGLSANCPNTDGNRQPMVQRLNLVQEQTNAGFRDSGVSGVAIRIVEMRVLNEGFDGGPDGFTLDWLASNTEIESWRAAAGADLVSLITGRGTYCGIARLRSPWSVTAYNCFGGYSFTHELAHNIGCNHNREDAGANHPFAYGKRWAGNWRTVLSYACPEEGQDCPRIPFFSNDQFQYLGLSMGDSATDNARMVVENAEAVSNFMGPKTSAGQCPETLNCPKGSYLMRRSYLFGTFCREKCISEDRTNIRSLLRWECGSCPEKEGLFPNNGNTPSPLDKLSP